MDGYFKLLRAEEEITRLNIEIRRLLTFMRDEDTFLSANEKEVGLTDPALAYQIHVERNDINRFTTRHMKNLNHILQLPGFTGSMSFGIHITEPSLRLSSPTPPPITNDPVITMVEDDQADLEADLEEEQAGEDEEQEVMAAYSTILEFTFDG